MPRLLRVLALLTLGSLVAGCATLPPGWPPTKRSRPNPRDKNTYIYIFHIGQADCMLIVHRGKTMMIDAGATWSKVGRENFRDIPHKLEHLTGRRHLDYFVVSHYHQDHIGLHGVGNRAGVGDLGLWGLINDYDVTVGTMVDRGFMVLGKKIATQRHYEKAVAGWLDSGKVKRRLKVKKGDLLDMGKGLQVKVIAADGNGHMLDIHRRLPDFSRKYPASENDYSIVLKITKGDFEMVTGGDLSGYNVARSFGPMRISYNDIESLIAEDIGDIEVYRVHHHGSKNSSNPCFMRVLHPEVSIMSSGENHYGHPAPRVYNALKKMGDIYIVSGAAAKYRSEMADDIREEDINIMVSPRGRRYWVEDRVYRSLTEKQESMRKGRVAGCTREGKEITAKDFKKVRGGQYGGD